ncbi:MAG: cyclic pyranopterin monophosphate synthase MoaC [Chloroflexi bacterium]|nr:cyclic pyranopterin monophosphate synthase MoaC [Chloroflexota bacterium]MYB21005.1 cyclic pyranopterin monophosphate synthase MoaC [Chloroflexota bacterium]MYF22499.1 cyclic pyranopterin monophosphate synthase MoaC [Chloroflexota bacterium]MYF80691.1 cyclic pyranopterin monophosphate synthase MoaC [Chloroflexota bacterium]MYI03498.1 cyclic pyranopterin monophosphate synthase MoaC [Chloroflexota bacterium]
MAAEQSSDSPQELSHLDTEGRARMVDVGAKDVSERRAVAEGRVLMQPETLDLIRDSAVKKGDVLTTAEIAGVMAAKRTHELIPLCHPLMLNSVRVELSLVDEPPSVAIRAEVRCSGKTGVEMEALTAVSVAALTVYDMAKAVDRGMRIDDVRLREKDGGRSGSVRLD